MYAECKSYSNGGNCGNLYEFHLPLTEHWLSRKNVQQEIQKPLSQWNSCSFVSQVNSYIFQMSRRHLIHLRNITSVSYAKIPSKYIDHRFRINISMNRFRSTLMLGLPYYARIVLTYETCLNKSEKAFGCNNLGYQLKKIELVLNWTSI